MKAKFVFEALRDVLQPRSEEEIKKEVFKRLNQYKIPVGNLFQRAQHAPDDTKILLNFIEKNHFKPTYLIPYNAATKTLLHHISVNFKANKQLSPPEWNLYKYNRKKAIAAFSNTGFGEVLIFGEEFLNYTLNAIETLS